uniref:Uncharacterized protein n=1 Tax=Plectus sambesii TaxID=2011161 RepID=A0A914X5N3_9BILA
MKAPLLAVSVLFLVAFIDLAYSRRIKRSSDRWKRTVITGSADASATGNMTNTGNTLIGVQTDNGDQGVNYTSGGEAKGENNITVNNQVSGAIDYENGTFDSSMAAGSLGAKGANSSGVSQINGVVVGPDNFVNSYQQGKGIGAGETAANMNGSAIVIKDGLVSPYSTEDVRMTAGATGSHSSSSEVIAMQNVTWDSIIADLIATSGAEGTNNADANVDFLATNTNGRGVEGNGMMSGSGGEIVTALVNGNAHIVNDNQTLLMNQYGHAQGPGSASMVGAGSLSTFSNDNKTIATFGDGRSDVDSGTSEIEAIQESRLNSENGGWANNHMNATATAGQKNITASNGIQVSDQNGPTLVVGGGNIEGWGNRNASGIMNVDSSYNQYGEAQVVISGDASSVTVNGTDKLNISSKGQLEQPAWATSNNGMTIAEGAGKGESSNDTGTSFLAIDGYGANGNVYMDHIGNGANYSDGATRAELWLNDSLAGDRHASSAGDVAASGDYTSVRSVSGMTDYVGMQTFSSYQQSNGSGAGSSGSQGSLVINMPNAGGRRRKRDDGKPTPDVQDFELMRICPDAEQAQTGCPLFMKVYDPITGAASWKHMELSDLVKNLYGQPVSSISSSGDDTTVVFERPSTSQEVRQTAGQPTDNTKAKVTVYTKGEGVQTITATEEGGFHAHSSASLRK